MYPQRYCVGWAKRSVLTTQATTGRWWARRMRAFAHPAVLGERTTPANLRHLLAKHLQLRNAIFGAVEPPTKLAALHHHHIGKRPNPTGRTGGLFLAAIPDILANRSVR
jgi:hypothetical protein